MNYNSFSRLSKCNDRLGWSKPRLDLFSKLVFIKSTLDQLSNPYLPRRWSKTLVRDLFRDLYFTYSEAWGKVKSWKRRSKTLLVGKSLSCPFKFLKAAHMATWALENQGSIVRYRVTTHSGPSERRLTYPRAALSPVFSGRSFRSSEAEQPWINGRFTS